MTLEFGLFLVPFTILAVLVAVGLWNWAWERGYAVGKRHGDVEATDRINSAFIDHQIQQRFSQVSKEPVWHPVRDECLVPGAKPLAEAEKEIGCG